MNSILFVFMPMLKMNSYTSLFIDFCSCAVHRITVRVRNFGAEMQSYATRRATTLYCDAAQRQLASSYRTNIGYSARDV